MGPILGASGTPFWDLKLAQNLSKIVPKSGQFLGIFLKGFGEPFRRLVGSSWRFAGYLEDLDGKKVATVCLL